jgi:hypothetical protein
LDAGNVVPGVVRSNTRPFKVETPVGVFELDCGVVPVPGRDGHAHSSGEKVNILISRRGVWQAAEGNISGVVVDVIFRQDGFKVTLDNGLDFFLPNAPKMGERINLTIPAMGIKCLS